MERNYEESLRRLLLSEGGYDNHPDDPGGPTNFGITIYDAQKYAAEFGWKPAGYRITIADMKAMPLWFAKKVYRDKYWDSQRCSELPDGLDYTLFDYGVNSGIGRSKKVLQRVLGINDDGVLGPLTMQAIARVPAKEIITEINDERLYFLQRLKTWPVFGKGWGRRVAGVKATSLAWNQTPLVAKVESPATAPALPGNAPGKAQVPMPTGTRNSTVGGLTGGAAAAAWSLTDWIAAHPWETGMIGFAAVTAAGLAIDSLYKKAKAKQDAPASGWVSPRLLAQAV